MRHCDDAEAAQQMIGAIEAGGTSSITTSTAPCCGSPTATPTPRRTRTNSPRRALAFKYAAEEKTTLLADVVWDVGRSARSPRSRCSSPCSWAGRP